MVKKFYKVVNRNSRAGVSYTKLVKADKSKELVKDINGNRYAVDGITPLVKAGELKPIRN